LFDQIDGQYAGAAREMMMRGDWLTPTQDGVPRLQKPPLVYWCEVISLRVLGVNEFGARFPVVLAAVGGFLATILLAKRVIGTRAAAFAAALALAMFSGTFFFTHHALGISLANIQDYYLMTARLGRRRGDGRVSAHISSEGEIRSGSGWIRAVYGGDFFC
jgi:hypothetical protein